MRKSIVFSLIAIIILYIVLYISYPKTFTLENLALYLPLVPVIWPITMFFIELSNKPSLNFGDVVMRECPHQRGNEQTLWKTYQITIKKNGEGSPVCEGKLESENYSGYSIWENSSRSKPISIDAELRLFDIDNTGKMIYFYSRADNSSGIVTKELDFDLMKDKELVVTVAGSDKTRAKSKSFEVGEIISKAKSY